MKKSEIESAVRHLKQSDRVMSKIIEQSPACTLRSHNDYYYSLLEAIVGQQLSMKAAESIMHKFDMSHLHNELQMKNC